MTRLLCLLLCAAALGSAQSPFAVLSGRILDPAGLAVPEADVRVKALNSDLQRSTLSGADGVFRIDALPAGAYQVRVERSGFASYELGRVELQVRQVVDLDIRLAIGGRAETVRVEGKITPLDAAPEGIGFTVAETQVRGLPLADRNFVSLATLGLSFEKYSAG